jgi:hypothetical protein
LYAGAGGFNGEDVALGNDGGNVNIYAGASTNNGTGGAIVLQAGASGGTGGSGSITLRTETTGNVDRDWVFNNAGTLTLPLGGTIAESVGTTSFVGGVTLTVADVASFAVPGFPAATVNALAGSFTNDGFQYIQFGDWDVTAIQALVTDAGGSSSAVLPITWGAGSTALTGYVLVQITDASTFQMCPVVDADGGSNTPVSGTWFFTANIGNGIAVVGTDTIDLTVGTHTWAFGADGDIVNDEGESFLKDIPQNFPTGYDEGFYALQASDRGRHILIDGTEGFSIMVPTDATDLMPIGSAIVLVIKPGEYSIVVGPEDSDAMTIHGAGVSSVGYYELNAGNGGAMATLVKIGANEWMISGTGLAEWEGP